MALRRFLHRLRGRNPDSVAHYSALNPVFIADSDLAQQWQAQGFDPWFGPRGWNAARHRAAFLFDRMQLARETPGEERLQPEGANDAVAADTFLGRAQDGRGVTLAEIAGFGRAPAQNERA